MAGFRYPLEDIRGKIDIVDVISTHVSLTKRGRRYIGLCPFHAEKTPSFHVDPDRGSWKCFGCGEGGDVFSFSQKADNLSFPEAVEQLARKAGVEIDRSEEAQRQTSDRERIIRANNVASAFFRSSLTRSKPAMDYLAGRGLGESAIEKYKIGFAPDDWAQLASYLARERVEVDDALKAGLVVARENGSGYYDRFRNRIMFPIMDVSDRIIAFAGRIFGDGEPKYMNSPETLVFAKNRVLYGLNFARKAVATADQIIIVEGYLDVITAQEAGFEHCAAPMGTALTEEQGAMVARYTKNVVLAFDADSAGLKAALRSAPLFERAGTNVRILDMPDGEDPDSMLRSGDRSRFAGLLEKALPVPDFRIKKILASYDMNSDEGKSDSLREAAAVLGEIESAMERERLIRFLARFHPNFSSGTAHAEDHIRNEAMRARARVSQERRGRPIERQNVGSEIASKKPSLVEKTERTILALLVLQKASPEKVFETLPAKEFTTEGARLLAEALDTQWRASGTVSADSLRSLLTDTAGEPYLTDMLVGLDDAELNHTLEELIKVVDTHKRIDRRPRMSDLAKKIREGTVSQSDEEYGEYLKLLRETSGPFRR